MSGRAELSAQGVGLTLLDYRTPCLSFLLDALLHAAVDGRLLDGSFHDGSRVGLKEPCRARPGGAAPPRAALGLASVTSQQIPGHAGARLGGAGYPDLHAGFERGVDACSNTVAEDHPQLEASGVDGTAMNHGNMLAAIVAVIFGAGARTQGDVGTDDRVTDVAVA